MKYIDAEKLITEIERRKDKYDPHYTNAGRELEELLSFTKSLRQEQPQVADASKMERPKVDWEKEIDKFLNETGAPYVWCNDDEQKDWCNIIARYFWNKGYNARKEQPELPGYDKALLEVKSKVDELYEEAGIGLCEYDCGLYNGIAETCMTLRGFIKARLGSDVRMESELEKAARYVYESWMGGTMDDVRRDMVELGKVLNARN